MRRNPNPNQPSQGSSRMLEETHRGQRELHYVMVYVEKTRDGAQDHWHSLTVSVVPDQPILVCSIEEQTN